MVTNISNSEKEHIKKNLAKFPYRGLLTDLAKSLGRAKSNVYRSVVYKGNDALLAEIKRRADKRTKQLQSQA